MIMLKNTDKRKNPVSITFMMLLTVLTALTLLFGNSVQEVYAAQSDTDIFGTSDNEDGTVTIIEYYGKEESLTIPAYIDGKKVTKIGENVFSYDGKLKTVVISEGIEAIGKYAFYNCNVLEKVQLPDSLKSIEAGAFAGCKVLTQIILPQNLEELGDQVFSWCEKLEKLEVPGSLGELPYSSLYQCTGLKEVIIQEGITKIGGSAFSDCTSLEKLELPEGLKEIGYGAFSHCTSLTELELPQTLESIGNQFIYGCNNIKKMVIPDNVKDINGYILSGSSLEYLELPSTMDTISYWFFYYLSTLKEITFKGYVKSISSAGTPPQNLKINAYYSSVLEKFASDNDLEYNILGYLQYESTKRVADKSGALEYDKPTIEQIKQMEAAVTLCDLKYVVEPSTKAPYAAGQLTDEYINTGITAQNYFRYIAGLPEVYADDELNTSAQYGTTLLAIADTGLSHTPSQPEGVPDDFYKKGYDATSSSNLGMGHRSFYNFVSSCMNDGGSYTNYTTVGHRRWLLSTKSKYVGYGRTGSYFATKVFDDRADEFDFDFISWPASGNFPVSAISEWAGWSIAVNLDKYMEPVTGEVKVKVTRQSDGKVWDIVSTDKPQTYSECSGTRCFISPGGYGGWKLGTILVYLDDNELQGKYTVEVTGLYDLYGSDVSIKYDVNFFDENTEDDSKDDSDDEFAGDFNGFYYDEAANNWYCIAGGQKAMNYTGLWYDATVGWWYVKDGVIDFTFNGFVPYADAWWCVAGGRVCFEYTGLWNDATVGWWYVENGAINFAHNGLVPYADAWWCVAGGRVCFEYTGLWSDAAVGWWYVENGAINFAYNGLVPYAGAWWCVGGGRVCFEYTGLWNDAAVGWWYVENGGINFGYTGNVLYNGTYFNVYGGQVIF